MPERRFLIVRLGSLGDIVHAFPAVGALRESFPNAEIGWLTHPKWELLVRSSDLATDIWTVDTRHWRNLPGILKRLRQHRFDTAIDYQGLWKSAAIPFLARVPERIGFSSATVREAGVPVLYTTPVKVNLSAHIADQNGELSLQAGARTATTGVSLQIFDDDQRVVSARLLAENVVDYIVLCPGGGWRSKCWPAERFGQLAKQILQEFGVRCVINVGPGEEDLAGAVLRSAEGAQPVSFAGSLGQLMALLKSASAVVAGDTGPLHLADALGTCIVAIFGPTDPARNGPYRRSGVVLRWEGATNSYKRADTADESLLHISVDQVMNALRGLRSAA
jgi:lipopolysaccharide heptosyltransferase I